MNNFSNSLVFFPHKPNVVDLSCRSPQGELKGLACPTSFSITGNKTVTWSYFKNFLIFCNDIFAWLCETFFYRKRKLSSTELLTFKTSNFLSETERTTFGKTKYYSCRIQSLVSIPINRPQLVKFWPGVYRTNGFEIFLSTFLSFQTMLLSGLNPVTYSWTASPTE